MDNAHVIVWLKRDCAYADLPYEKKACQYCEAYWQCQGKR